MMIRVLKLKRARRGKFRLIGALLLFTLSFASPARAELPPPGANMELIPAGSLIIAMDNDKQNIGAVFNLNAYGLANHLLWEGVRVKWAIRAGKSKDGIDFSVMAQRILPTASAPAALDFRGGPFIVHADFAAYALSRITAFGNNVAVYETTADVMAVSAIDRLVNVLGLFLSDNAQRLWWADDSVALRQSDVSFYYGEADRLGFHRVRCLSRLARCESGSLPPCD